MEQRPQLLICWYSASGTNAQLANAAFQAASQVPGCVTKKKAALRIDKTCFEDAHAYLFIAPENFGQLCGGLRMMFERLYYPLEHALQGRPYATITGCGNDGRGAVRDIDRICTGWRLRRIAEPLICRGTQTDDHLQDSRELAQALAIGLADGVF